MWLETKAVGGFLNEPRIFHNMYVLGNLLSKYIDVRTLRTYRVTNYFVFLSEGTDELMCNFKKDVFHCSQVRLFQGSHKSLKEIFQFHWSLQSIDISNWKIV